ncbi:hypothetical protein I7I50_00606 [Histoplasma capsulatum G186AR]|uniref:Uncharacterized protein n=1 Tax=Ajellomyces capsulatus TaxID=5037 RepID=A0A8H7YE80_AJECA|nr:hypothetical protein I7I52_07874 [Histoplasma capsulatum]QSS72683.1 hypothetical protein I7I50_00606 [Histoplasma capsulatum G186AR]
MVYRSNGHCSDSKRIHPQKMHSRRVFFHGVSVGRGLDIMLLEFVAMKTHLSVASRGTERMVSLNKKKKINGN